MRKPGTPFVLRAIGIVNMIIGGFVIFWLLTVGLYATLYAFDLNKTPSVLVNLFLALLFGTLFLIGGIGIIRSRARGRTYLTITWVISVFLMAAYIIGELRYGFSKDGIGSEFFDFWSWLGGIVFWSVMIIVGVLHVRFLNSSKVKEHLVP